MVNSFGIASRTRGPLSVRDILKSVMPAIQHQNQDVRNAAGKILLDVQRLSGCVTEDELEELAEKARNVLLQKLKKVEVEKDLRESEGRQRHLQGSVPTIREEEEGESTDCAEAPKAIAKNSHLAEYANAARESPSKLEARLAQVDAKKQVVTAKGGAKEWQEREVALKEMEELFKPGRSAKEEAEILEDDFIQHCLILLKSCLEDNNMTLYLQAVQVASLFFAKALGSETVLGSLQGLVQPVVLRTTDTNTRVRKKSVDLIYQIWEFKPSQAGDRLKFGAVRDSQDGTGAGMKVGTIGQIVATTICDPQLGEKSIVGRLGLFVKRAQQIDAVKDLAQRPILMILGKNYEQVTEFACQWISHKNTKVRQNAMKLVVEICRVNCTDPRGLPFKQRIINYILGLRPNQRDPLVVKINEVCLKAVVAGTSPGRAGDLEAYINTSELELNVATKHRAASMDHVGAKRRLMSASRGGRQAGAPAGPTAAASGALPSIGNVQQPAKPGTGYASPTIVLPHSEPLSEEQKAQNQVLIDLFGLQLMTCFYSKSWSTRNTALLKVSEQLHNLDPARRDAMTAEINRQNLPIEINFKTFLDLVVEGLKDPVLKNYIALLELVQQALPVFFRYIQPHVIRSEVQPIVVGILRKTADMKQKIREASINFCLYLSHQSPVGPEHMVSQVIQELDHVFNEKEQAAEASSAAASFGNSHLISSCLGLLNEYQVQTAILSPERETPTLFKKFMDLVNAGLKHSNPQVRKEGEKLFKTLYLSFGAKLEPLLQDQKPQLVTKLLSQAKQDALVAGSQNQNQHVGAPNSGGQPAGGQEQNVRRAQDQIRDQVLDKSSLKSIFEGIEVHLQALKLPNVKKRQQAIVDIKKTVSKQIVGGHMNQERAREMFEPLVLLMRQLLQDESSEIYLESLNLLKFIVGSLAPYLSTLDLHLMMGSFIGIIVQNTVSGNIRIQVSSDKVIVFFAKHQNIGPFVVAKEVTKNIEKINKAVSAAGASRAEALNEKKPTLLRFFGILQFLLQQFSIVLCYQPEFYTKVLECLADAMINCSPKNPTAREGDAEEVVVKTLCTQILQHLYAVDYKLLDQSVGKLSDINRKTPLRKAIIEHEGQQKQGKGLVDFRDGSAQPLVSQPTAPVDRMRDTGMSFASSTKESLFSPGSETLTRDQSMGGFGKSQYEGPWGRRFEEEQQRQTIESSGHTATRRMMSLGERRNPSGMPSNEKYLANHPISTLTQSSWRRERDVLPAIEGAGQNLNKTGVLLPKIGDSLGIGTGL